MKFQFVFFALCAFSKVVDPVQEARTIAQQLKTYFKTIESQFEKGQVDSNTIESTLVGIQGKIQACQKLQSKLRQIQMGYTPEGYPNKPTLQVPKAGTKRPTRTTRVPRAKRTTTVGPHGYPTAKTTPCAESTTVPDETLIASHTPAVTPAAIVTPSVTPSVTTQLLSTTQPLATTTTLVAYESGRPVPSSSVTSLKYTSVPPAPTRGVVLGKDIKATECE
jgi:hypothetical protein